jgi:hypothetical protein
MIASILMRHKSSRINADNKGFYGRWQQVAPVVAAGYALKMHAGTADGGYA